MKLTAYHSGLNKFEAYRQYLWKIVSSLTLNCQYGLSPQYHKIYCSLVFCFEQVKENTKLQ